MGEEIVTLQSGENRRTNQTNQFLFAVFRCAFFHFQLELNSPEVL